MEQEPSFEEAVDRLEQIVGAMESGSLSLDESLSRFQQAVALSRYCAAKLEEAEKQVAILSGDEPMIAGTALPWEVRGEAGMPQRLS